ncbi:hypothetical protein VNO77_46931 [Canavalia gladiata]|uniref:Uncharacterized protein n=1 Tax=Canavalia gladiata TaxID=3824 RepID=A0AAN9JG08_CANGL
MVTTILGVKLHGVRPSNPSGPELLKKGPTFFSLLSFQSSGYRPSRLAWLPLTTCHLAFSLPTCPVGSHG